MNKKIIVVSLGLIGALSVGSAYAVRVAFDPTGVGTREGYVDSDEVISNTNGMSSNDGGMTANVYGNGLTIKDIPVMTQQTPPSIASSASGGQSGNLSLQPLRMATFKGVELKNETINSNSALQAELNKVGCIPSIMKNLNTAYIVQRESQRLVELDTLVGETSKAAAGYNGNKSSGGSGQGSCFSKAASSVNSAIGSVNSVLDIFKGGGFDSGKAAAAIGNRLSSAACEAVDTAVNDKVSGITGKVTGSIDAGVGAVAGQKVGTGLLGGTVESIYRDGGGGTAPEGGGPSSHSTARPTTSPSQSSQPYKF